MLNLDIFGVGSKKLSQFLRIEETNVAKTFNSVQHKKSHNQLLICQNLSEGNLIFRDNLPRKKKNNNFSRSFKNTQTLTNKF